ADHRLFLLGGNMGKFDERCETISMCVDCPFRKTLVLCKEAYDNCNAIVNEILSKVKKEIEQVEERRK
ncbi:MAG: hypothetical protein IKF82_04570, partial [Bacilli bacterium]|nr:hypothetical protein [Bacilli bacterium]